MLNSSFSICSLVSLLTLSVSMTACQTLPSNAHLNKSTQLTQKAHSRQPTFLANTDSGHSTPHSTFKHLINYQQNNPPSGYYPIATGADALDARSSLTKMARSTIDIQYYIWHNDKAGRKMIKELWQAAECGVVVRLLLDDFNSSPTLDELLLAFDQHPNVAVRLSNPFAHRRFKAIDFLTNPTRINRRMHNKSMTFDNELSIIGGRNIGNEYLNHHKNNNFADLDVLLAGSVVKDINQSFEQYWSSPLSYDIRTLVKPSPKKLFDLIEDDMTDDTNSRTNPFTQTIAFRWADIEFLVDDVGKLDKSASLDEHLVSLLQHKLGHPNKRISIISSYFVPTKDGVLTLRRLARSGVKINILTNSFDASDVGVVHAGYGHWRHDLLAAGINLYEIKSTAINTKQNDNKFWRTKQITTTSLHAKAFAIDDEQVFIGSYNIDPRSANINTELGVLIYDERLAMQLHNALQNQKILNQAYKVVLTKQNTLEWHTLEDGKYTVYTNEPNMSLKDRAGVALMAIMPIDWLL
ncbi:phospholipase D-like domain-containing protein [Moraxella sp. ZY200743]|uniref:phospholipase D-like domain-containing protein n=1 Tax=Moraxella sp. ZY200743 TaxID=2911970 RepID=UPI003D7F0F08